MEGKSEELIRKYFIVEHVDHGLFDWALCEYHNIMRYLQNTNAKLVFTNTQNFEDPTSDENPDYLSNVKSLHDEHERRGGNMNIELKQKIGAYIHNREALSFDDTKAG